MDITRILTNLFIDLLFRFVYYDFMKCINCNKETNNKKFCSRSCSAIFTNKIVVKRKKTKKCICCNDLILTSQTYCKKCKPKNILNDMTLQEAMYIDCHRSSVYAKIRSRARSQCRSRNQVCEICGYSKHVEVCHIRPIHFFPLDTLISEINSSSNLKLLCPNCHWEFDNSCTGSSAG